MRRRCRHEFFWSPSILSMIIILSQESPSSLSTLSLSLYSLRLSLSLSPFSSSHFLSSSSSSPSSSFLSLSLLLFSLSLFSLSLFSLSLFSFRLSPSPSISRPRCPCRSKQATAPPHQAQHVCVSKSKNKNSVRIEEGHWKEDRVRIIKGELLRRFFEELEKTTLCSHLIEYIREKKHLCSRSKLGNLKLFAHTEPLTIYHRMGSRRERQQEQRSEIVRVDLEKKKKIPVGHFHFQFCCSPHFQMHASMDADGAFLESKKKTQICGNSESQFFTACASVFFILLCITTIPLCRLWWHSPGVVCAVRENALRNAQANLRSSLLPRFRRFQKRRGWKKFTPRLLSSFPLSLSSFIKLLLLLLS